MFLCNVAVNANQFYRKISAITQCHTSTNSKKTYYKLKNTVADNT